MIYKEHAPIALAILGPTAVGKSSLALALAQADSRIELISADSMQVYRQMDIGTAKPTQAEQEQVRHHLIDIIEPWEQYSLSLFVENVHSCANEIRDRDGIAVMVGGTALYVQAIVDALEIPGQYDEVRGELETLPTEELFERLGELDPLAQSRIEANNRRRLLRALEVCIGSGKAFSSYGPGLDAYPTSPIAQVFIDRARPTLDVRIEARYHQQIEQGFLDEVKTLRAIEPPISRTAKQALGYKELFEYLDGEYSFDEALDLAIRRTRRFARRQQRWLRRDPRVQRLDLDELSSGEAVSRCLDLIEKRNGVL